MAERLIMDDATKEKLHGLLPFSTKATINYTPELYKDAETPEEFRPVFVLRPYARDEVKSARKVISSTEKDEVQKEDNFIELSRKVVVRWYNLYDVGTGEEIEYVQDPTGGACKELYDGIPTPVKAAILIQAIKISGLFDLAKLGLKF